MRTRLSLVNYGETFIYDNKRFMKARQYELDEQRRLEQMSLHAIVDLETGQISHTHNQWVFKEVANA